MEQLTCHGRFVGPFVRALDGYRGLPASGLARLRALATQERVPLAEAGAALEGWARRCGDESLGLRAGRAMQLGCGGPLDYAMRSAATLRQSVQVAIRYSRLFSDALLPKLELEGERAIIRLDSSLGWRRVIADFTMSSWYATHMRPHRDEAPRRLPIECCFAHARPKDGGEYQRAFDGNALRFDAGFYGFVLDAKAIDLPLISADALLHAAHIEHLELVSAQLEGQGPRNVAARVRRALGADLRCGIGSAEGVARALHISRRTLARRLEEEGTTFSAVLDAHRRELGLRYVARSSLALSEVSQRLGFSQVQGFGRAFRRWTGRSPLEYRNAAQSAA